MAPTLGQLPSELILLIAKHLDVPSINVLLQTCQRFSRVLDPVLYKLARRYRSVPSAGTPLIWAVKTNRLNVMERLLDGKPWPADNENGTTALHEAVYAQNEDAFRLLLRAGADVFALNANRDAALHAAIKCEYALAARLIISVYPTVMPWESYAWHWTEALLQAAATAFEPLCRLVVESIIREYPDQVPDLLNSALHTAAGPTGHLGIIQLLCGYGADPLASAPWGTATLLHTFAHHGRLEAARWGLALGINPTVVDSTGETAFSIAVARGHLALVQTFLAVGMDPELPTRGGITPLCKAAAGGHMPVVQCLLDAGADIRRRDDRGFNVVDFVTTAREDTGSMLEFLLQRGADPSPPAGTVRMTALHSAARLGLVKRTALLCSASPVDAIDQRGRTALHLAVREGHAATVEVLLQAGANPSVADERQKTPLHEAVATSSTDIVKQLLRHGACVRAADVHGHTPLHLAAIHGNYETCLTLVEHCQHKGIDFSSQCLDGDTVLAEAVRHGRTAIVAMLIEAGFDPNVHWTWSSVLHLAAAERDAQMVALLLASRADAYCLDLYGRSAFDWAAADPDTLSAMLMQRPRLSTDSKKREIRLRQTVATFGRRLLETRKNGRGHSHGCDLCIVARALVYLGEGDAARLMYAYDGEMRTQIEEHTRPVCTRCQDRLEGGSWFVCLACAGTELCLSCRDRSLQGEGPGKACQSHELYEIPQETLELPGENEIGRDQAWREWIERLVSVHTETSDS